METEDFDPLASPRIEPSTLSVVPLTLGEAHVWVTAHHRHHQRSVGALFAIGASLDDRIVGPAVVGRPVAPRLQDGWTVEVNRLCCLPQSDLPSRSDGHAWGVPSMLYRAAWRAARAMGYRRLITYTLVSEPGTSLVAAGFTKTLATTRDGQGWNQPGRPRVDKHPLQQKFRWEVAV